MDLLTLRVLPVPGMPMICTLRRSSTATMTAKMFSFKARVRAMPCSKVFVLNGFDVLIHLLHQNFGKFQALRGFFDLDRCVVLLRDLSAKSSPLRLIQPQVEGYPEGQ